MSEKWLSDEELKQILGEQEESEQKKENDIREEESDVYYEDIPSDVEIRPVQLEEFEDSVFEPTGEIPDNFQSLFDVNIEITVVLGRTKMLLEDVLALDVNSVVKLDKLAGEPAEILIDDQVVARGDVVILDEQFAVEIKEIIHPRERVRTVQRKLKK